MQIMAAGQRKKKLNGARPIALDFYEHNTGRKKTKTEASDVTLNMTSHVSLEWDERASQVVAKREQIGIRWRDMAPFLKNVPEFQTTLADVLSVPSEVFGLDNVSVVLSYEVWKALLSEGERMLLIQLLPKGVDADKVVQSLLAGENFHFGNPFYKWGASLCSGTLHPDAIKDKERQLRVIRNSYLRDLADYHSAILKDISRLKERWPTCNSPEKENAGRIRRKGTKRSLNRNPATLGKAKILSSSKKEQPQNSCFHSGDTTKYMSCIKVNKKQHQLVKSICHSQGGVHSKCLNHALGDIKDLHVQPYAAFEDEERKRLHEHWLQLANKNVLAAFENRRQSRLSREKLWKGVMHELVGKLMSKGDGKNAHSTLQEVDDENPKQESSADMQNEKYVKPISSDDHNLERNPLLVSHQDPSLRILDQEHVLKASTCYAHQSIDNHVEKIPSLNSSQEFISSTVDQAKNGYIDDVAMTYPGPLRLSRHDDGAEDAMESKASFANAHYIERNPSLNTCRMSRIVDVNKDVNQHLEGFSHSCPAMPQLVGCVIRADEGTKSLSVSSSKDIWQSSKIDHSHHQFSPDRIMTDSSAAELTLQQQKHTREQLLDFRTKVLERETADSVSSSLTDNGRVTMLNPNANQDHNLLHSPFHMEGTSYSQEPLNGSGESGLQFLGRNDDLQPSNQYFHLIDEQPQLFNQSQSRGKGLYMQPMLNRDLYSNSSHQNPGGHFFPVGLQNLSNFQFPLDSGLAAHKWFMGEQGTRNAWSGAEGYHTSDQCIGGTRNADGSLFSVFSECNKLHSHSQFVNTNSEAFLPGGSVVSMGNQHSSGTYRYAPVPSDASGTNIAALKINSLSWMNALQNHGL